MLSSNANVVSAKLLSTYASSGFIAANETDYIDASNFLRDDFLLGQEITDLPKKNNSQTRVIK